MVRISPACGPLGVLTIVLFGTAAPCRADNPATAAVPAQAPGPFNPGLEAGPGQPGGPEEHTLSISTPSAGDPACSWTAPQPGDCRASTGQVWASADYLLWWITKGPLNDPLVTRGNPADTHPGAIGQPGTSVLFGGQGLDFNSFSGGRVTLGGWLDADQRFGAEGSGFLLEDRALGFAAAGDANGNPPIYVPLFRADLGREGSYTVSSPAFPVVTGGALVSADSRLWGGECNGVVNLLREQGFTLDALAGFRYLDLQETLGMQVDVNSAFFGIQQQLSDAFGTRDQFYGGQVGLRGGLQLGAWQAQATCKLALGETHETATIVGQSIQAGTGAAAVGPFPGGLFAQPSNSGRQTSNPFTVVPQMQAQIQRQIWGGLSAYADFDALYWSDVVRPGGLVDRSLNLTQQFGAPLAGPAAPLPRLDHTNFWAEGVSFGLCLQF